MQRQEATKMTEHLKSQHESNKDNPELNIEAKHLPNIDKLNQEALEKAAEKVDVDELKDTASERAKSSSELMPESKPEPAAKEFGAYTELKSQTYSRTLKRVQTRLSPSERTMSKVMHNKTVEKVSDGLGKTAARPSGVLGGGIVALLGSFILLYMAKKYGFEYNFAVFFVLMAAGFALGVLLEFTLFALRKVRP
jgi:hypothetical protein